MGSATISKPKWLDEWRKRTRIIQIIEKSYELGCDCEVCKELRSLGVEMEALMQAAPMQPPINFGGGEGGSQSRRKR